MYRRHKGKGFVILGFPCNQFGAQEPGSENQIKSFVQSKFDVTFPVYAKIRVNGKEEAPLFSFLKDEARGVLGTVDVKWNFQKFLVDRDGKPIMRYSPMAKPEDIEGDIENALAAPPSHASRM